MYLPTRPIIVNAQTGLTSSKKSSPPVVRKVEDDCWVTELFLSPNLPTSDLPAIAFSGSHSKRNAAKRLRPLYVSAPSLGLSNTSKGSWARLLSLGSPHRRSPLHIMSNPQQTPKTLTFLPVRKSPALDATLRILGVIVHISLTPTLLPYSLLKGRAVPAASSARYTRLYLPRRLCDFLKQSIRHLGSLRDRSCLDVVPNSPENTLLCWRQHPNTKHQDLPRSTSARTRREHIIRVAGVSQAGPSGREQKQQRQ